MRIAVEAKLLASWDPSRCGAWQDYELLENLKMHMVTRSIMQWVIFCILFRGVVRIPEVLQLANWRWFMAVFQEGLEGESIPRTAQNYQLHPATTVR